MANYSELLNDINAAIYENNDQEIDALEVRAILREMVTSLGSGFLFKGIATPSSPSGTGTYEPDQNVFYLATTAGTYTYLGGLVVAAGEVAFLCYDGTWTKKSSALLSTGSIVDNTTTEDATKPLSAKQGKVLADAGAATAAEVTALGHEVDELYFARLLDAHFIEMEQGTIVATTGANTNDSTVIRVKNAVSTSIGKLAVPAGFTIWRAIYYSAWTDASTYTYSSWKNVSSRYFTPDTNYQYVRILIRNSSNTAIIPADFESAIHLIAPRLESTIGEVSKKVDGVSYSLGMVELSGTITQTYKAFLSDCLIPKGTAVLSLGVVTDMLFFYTANGYEVVTSSDLPYILQHDIIEIRSRTSTGAYDLILQFGYGYRYIGQAAPSTDPGSPREMVCYLATSSGTYTNFDGIVVADGENALLKWAGSWSKETIILHAINTQQVWDNPFKNSGSVAASSTLTLPHTRVRKNSTISAKIKGTISSVLVGVGYTSASPYREYEAAWVEITPTQIVAHRYYTSDSVIGTYSHGLDLSTGEAAIVILCKWNGTTGNVVTVKLYDGNGNSFSQNINSWGMGAAFVTNNNTSGSLSVELSFVPQDLSKSVWVFGDSYLSYGSNQRWPYYLGQEGLIKWLLNNQPGIDAGGCWDDLENLIALNQPPKVIVWLLACNGGADVDGAVNPAWLGITNQLIALCASYGIELILETMPCLPSRDFTKLNDWVRNSGIRYIDFAEAVDNGVDDYWKNWGTATAMLSSDEVHPTEYGARALAARAMLDCPELTIDE